MTGAAIAVGAVLIPPPCGEGGRPRGRSGGGSCGKREFGRHQVNVESNPRRPGQASKCERDPGPTRRGSRCPDAVVDDCLKQLPRWSWVPAFAGTTKPRGLALHRPRARKSPTRPWRCPRDLPGASDPELPAYFRTHGLLSWAASFSRIGLGDSLMPKNNCEPDILSSPPWWASRSSLAAISEVNLARSSIEILS